MQQKSSNCNACGLDKTKFIGIREGLRVVRCRGCGLYYLNPLPEYKKEEIQEIYSDDYYKDHWRGGDGRFGPRMQEMLKLSAELVLNRIESYSKGGKLLEVGCGYGEVLLEARKRGWQAQGVEISQAAVNYLQKFDLKVFGKSLEEVNFPQEEFDVVVLREALEHLTNPKDLLEEINRVIKTNGIIYLTVPNEASFYHNFFQLYYRINLAKRLKLTTSHLGPPYHLFGFSKKALTKILDSCGFVPLKTIVTYPESKEFPGLPLSNMSFKSRLERWIMIFGGVIGAGNALQVVARKVKTV